MTQIDRMAIAIPTCPACGSSIFFDRRFADTNEFGTALKRTYRCGAAVAIDIEPTDYRVYEGCPQAVIKGLERLADSGRQA